jgi:hypothetical protein
MGLHLGLGFIAIYSIYTYLGLGFIDIYNRYIHLVLRFMSIYSTKCIIKPNLCYIYIYMHNYTTRNKKKICNITKYIHLGLEFMAIYSI